MTATEHYNAYMTAALAVEPLKAQVKILWAEGEQAAIVVRKTTAGSVQEKIAAIRTSWVPFHQKIAEAEKSIAELQAKSDSHFDAWRGIA